MKLKTVEIENFRAIEKLTLPLDPQLTILHGANAHGKTSVLAAIAVGLGAISYLLPGGFARRVFTTDVRVGAPNLYVSLTTLDDVSWSGSLGFSTDSKPVRRRHVEALKDVLDELDRAHNQGLPVDLPIIACYGTDRVVLDLPEKPSEPSDFEADLGRYAALKGALSSGTNFQELFEWFYFKENTELREQRERRDLDYRIKDLTAVRYAISSMLNDVSEPHIEVNPHRFVVLLRTESENEKLDLGQLSGGYRAVLALAADLAWRMAHGNPHLRQPIVFRSHRVDRRSGVAPAPCMATAHIERPHTDFPECPVHRFDSQPPGAYHGQTGAYRGTRPKGWRHRCRGRRRVDLWR